ncbi:hypothetical protein IJI76_00985 [Candidatus Saccharibacteria bacterium]|nr:hypothetical protein [Candidatus Saccharibacteria bacterium]
MSNNGAQQFQFQIRLVNEPEKEKEKEKKPEVLKLNEPSHDVMVDENGDLDIVPEDVLESIDFPPEFAEFLGDAVRQLREIHGIPEEEDIPQELLNSLAEQLLRISEESPSSEMLAGGIETEPENVTGGGVVMPSENQERIEFTEEDLENLTPEENGSLVFENFQIDPPFGCKAESWPNWLALELPISGNKLAEENNVLVRIFVPYLKKVSMEEVEADPYLIAGSQSVFADDYFHLIDNETYDEYTDIMVYCGQCDNQAFNPEEVQPFAEKLANILDVAPYEKRENGYYEDLCEYWYNGEIYHEGDVIWIDIPYTHSAYGTTKGFVANLDAYGDFYTPRSISFVRDSDIEIDEDDGHAYDQKRVWQLATEYAKTKTTIGYAVVCLNKHFNIPVESMYNTWTGEAENLIVMFNVITCRPTHHRCCGIVIADVGNMQLVTGIRYYNGGTFNWDRRIKQELAAYRKYDPTYNPYDDPYDDLEATSYED